MTRQQVTWKGATIDGFTAEALVGEGLYSWVYSCTGPGNQRRAMKAAKPEADVKTGICATFAHPTQAIAQHTGSVGEIQPDANELLAFQIEKLTQTKTPGMPEVLNSLVAPGISYYQMDFVPGLTLHKLLEKGKIRTSTLITFGETLDRLLDDPVFKYHGDIKPQNIMVYDDQITILDPGYFGEISAVGLGTIYGVAVTTPMYYPELEPHDALAMGLMLWEVAMGTHPLTGSGHITADETKHGEDLYRYVEQYRLLGKGRWVAPFLALDRPSVTHPGIDPKLEEFLLYAIGLKLDAKGRLDWQRHRNSTVSDLTNRLRQLQSDGIEFFSATK